MIVTRNLDGEGVFLRGKESVPMIGVPERVVERKSRKVAAVPTTGMNIKAFAFLSFSFLIHVSIILPRGSDKIEARQAEGVVVEEEDEEELLEVSEIAETEDEPKPEPEDNTMSYEEYLASKQQPDNEAFAPVKEREVTNEFANLKPKVSDEEDFLVMGGGKQKKARAKKDEKQTVETSFRVTPNAGDRDSGRGRGRGRGVRGSGRGGRPGGRGGGRSGPRGSSRGERGSGRGRGRENLNVGDTRAFPSL